MDDAPFVGRRERLGDLRAEGGGLARRERPAGEALPQVLPLDDLHHEVRLPVLLADVVDRDDPGVVQSRRGAGLLDEAGEALGIPQDVLRQDLDRHLAREAAVAGTVDLSHAAGPEEADDFVRPEPASG